MVYPISDPVMISVFLNAKVRLVSKAGDKCSATYVDQKAQALCKAKYEIRLYQKLLTRVHQSNFGKAWFHSMRMFYQKLRCLEIYMQYLQLNWSACLLHLKITTWRSFSRRESGREAIVS